MLLPSPHALDRLSATITTRQVQQGKSVTVRGEVFHQRNGNMVTHFTFPREVVILANKLGETRIYDPRRNAVIRYQNEAFSTQTTQLAFFLNGTTSDMGLIRMGFVQDKTTYEGKLLVTEWRLKKPNNKAPVQRVKIVYDRANPVYMHYADGAGKIIRKVFYYGYQPIDGRPFPATTTEIVYQDRDSTVSKTVYADFKLNKAATSPYFEYATLARTVWPLTPTSIFGPRRDTNAARPRLNPGRTESRTTGRAGSVAAAVCPVRFAAVTIQLCILRAECRRNPAGCVPARAGALSTVVPGLGKVYAGKAKQGISAFLVLTLGLLTWEGYCKDGPASWRFLGFGSFVHLILCRKYLG